MELAWSYWLRSDACHANCQFYSLLRLFNNRIFYNCIFMGINQMAHLTFEDVCKYLEQNQLNSVSQPESKKQIFIGEFGLTVCVEKRR